MGKKQRKAEVDNLYSEDAIQTRADWKSYHKYVDDLSKELGPDQKEPLIHFEGMCIESAWGAANERTHGKRSEDAQVHWIKYRLHSGEAEKLYQGTANWTDIQQMITAAAWGAANECAFGASSAEARRDWSDHEAAALRVNSSHDDEL